MGLHWNLSGATVNIQVLYKVDDHQSDELIVTKILQRRADEQYVNEPELTHNHQGHEETGFSLTETPMNILRNQVPLQKNLPPAKVALPRLSNSERQIAEDLIDPDDIDDSFGDIEGFVDVMNGIYELAIAPLFRPEFDSPNKLVWITNGILLRGKPGTRKTMLAKSLAKKARAVFLRLDLSQVLNKSAQESNKLITGCFTLAQNANCHYFY
jgi:SpoVK/Ycf46/Vps4 family AAA+-type ATPase